MRTHLKPLLLALSIAAGTAMTAHAQPASSYTIPSDGTLLNVSAEAEAKRVPDIATLSAGWSPRPPTAMPPCARMPSR